MSVQIYGGNLATVALAEQLVKDGIDFYWNTLGEKLAGHFSGMRIQEMSFDVGMVLLEFSPGKNNPTNYRNREAEEASLGTFFSTTNLKDAVIKTMHSGSLGSDYIISDNISEIGHCGLGESSLSFQMKHPAKKWEDPWFEATDYESVCCKLYPNFYNHYLRKIVQKITSDNASLLSSRYHRLAWLPLYHPKTIQSLLPIEPYPFLRVSNGSVASLIEEKISFIMNSPHADVCHAKREKLSHKQLKHKAGTQKFFGCDIFKIPYVKAAFDMGKYFQPEYNICLLQFKEDVSNLPDCIYDVDDDNIFRISIAKNLSATSNLGFFEAKFSGESEVDFEHCCKHYSKVRLNRNIDKVLMTKVKMNGPRLPKAGAEKNLLQLNKLIEDEFASTDCHFYGPQSGLNALAMNKQINHALSTWRKLI